MRGGTRNYGNISNYSIKIFRKASIYHIRIYRDLSHRSSCARKRYHAGLFDDPGAVDALLDIITDYMIKIVPYIKSKISTDREWFFDWGAMWKGTARVCNCSVHMISPEFYCKHVLPRDTRLMEAIGGGRMHYCGTNSNVIKCFLQNDFIHSLDFDIKCYDLWSLSECASKNLTLGLSLDSSFETYHRLIKGEWPKTQYNPFLPCQIHAGRKKALDALRRSVRGDDRSQFESYHPGYHTPI